MLLRIDVGLSYPLVVRQAGKKAMHVCNCTCTHCTVNVCKKGANITQLLKRHTYHATTQILHVQLYTAHLIVIPQQRGILLIYTPEA